MQFDSHQLSSYGSVCVCVLFKTIFSKFLIKKKEMKLPPYLLISLIR